MRLFLYILLILMPVSAMAKQTLATTDITDERHLLELLDGYIEKRDVYAKQKEEKLKQLKLRLRTADDNAARLAILNSIYREYYTYRYDSALVYADRGLALSRSNNNAYYTTLNRINRAAVLSTGGLYSQSEALLNEIGKEGVPPRLRQYYYYTFTWLYNYWESFCDKSEFKDDLHKKKHHYLKLTVSATSNDNTALHAYLSGELAFIQNPLGKNVLSQYTTALKHRSEERR